MNGGLDGRKEGSEGEVEGFFGSQRLLLLPSMLWPWPPSSSRCRRLSEEKKSDVSPLSLSLSLFIAPAYQTLASCMNNGKISVRQAARRAG